MTPDPDYIELGSAHFYTDTWTPNVYTSVEGGRIYPWNYGPVSAIDLMQRDTHLVTINGKPVHSLGTFNKNGLVERWDCINGFTKGVKNL